MSDTASGPFERERRFLLKPDPLTAYLRDTVPESVMELRQAYLGLDPQRTIRVRLARPLAVSAFLTTLLGEELPKAGPWREAWLTLKGLSTVEDKQLVRREWELPLDPAQAGTILEELALKPEIHKLRARITAGEFCWELDLFLGQNKGLLLAELELPAGLELPERPHWLSDEITADLRYSNSALVTQPFEGWSV